MFKEWKRQWHAFSDSPPGSRFAERYERSRRARAGQPIFLRLLKPLLALVLLAAGVVLCVIPGPGIPLLVIGAGLLADESRFLARALDGTEVRLRKVIRQAWRWWSHAHIIVRTTVILLSAMALAAVAYGGFRFLGLN